MIVFSFTYNCKIILYFSGGNENEWNVVQNTKFKQQNYTIDQSKLQGFKVIHILNIAL